jgi:hypothetical protein
MTITNVSAVYDAVNNGNVNETRVFSVNISEEEMSGKSDADGDGYSSVPGTTPKPTTVTPAPSATPKPLLAVLGRYKQFILIAVIAFSFRSH